MSDDYIVIGLVSGVTGLDGGLRIKCTTDFPGRFDPGNRILIEIKGFHKEYTVDDFSLREKGKAVLHCSEIKSREEALRVHGCSIVIPREEARAYASGMNSDEYLYCDLLECSVYIREKEFGRVADILEGGGGIILVVSDGKQEFQIPFVDEMVDTSRFSERILQVDPVEGLVDF